MQPETLSISIAAALLIVAALHDMAFRTVPNTVPVTLALVGMSSRALSGQLLFGIIASSIVFIGGAWIWRRGWMGGGDVKLACAAALAIAPAQIPSMLMATSLAGGVLALPYMIARGRLGLAHAGTQRPPHSLLGRILRVERRRLRQGGPLPYAVAIAAGVLFIMFEGG